MSAIEIHDFMAKPACIGCGQDLTSKRYCDRESCRNHYPRGGSRYCEGSRFLWWTICKLTFPHLHLWCIECGAVFITRTAAGQKAFDDVTERLMVRDDQTEVEKTPKHDRTLTTIV